MKSTISRRELLKGAAVGASTLALRDVQAALASAGPVHAANQGGSSGRILPLTTSTDVFIPPRGRSFFKFSFDFPEPSVEFGGHRFSFRLYTFENAYSLDPGKLTVQEGPDGLDLRGAGFTWAGGQQRAPGTLHAQFRRKDSWIEWNVTAEMERPIKSIAAIVRDVPRGKMATGGG